jgi:hypothetical protein
MLAASLSYSRFARILKINSIRMEKTMKFKSKLGVAALEELSDDLPQVAQVSTFNPANEGLVGGLLGFVIGGAGWVIPGAGTVAGGVGANEADKLKREIKQITEAIKDAAVDNGKKAVKEGKLSSADFKEKIEAASFGTIFQGALLGTLFGGIYGAIKGSQIEDLQKELKAKCEQLDRLLQQAAVQTAKGKGGKNLKVAKESTEDADAAAVAAAGDDANATPPADGATPPAADDATPPADGAAAPDADAAAGDAAGAAATGDDATPPADDGSTPPADDGSTPPADDAAATDPAAAADAAQAADDNAAASASDAAAADAASTGEPTDAVGEDADLGDAEAEEVEGEMDAVDEIEDQEEDVQDDVSKLTDATESLEGCVAILDAAAQRGGLDLYGASLLRNNLNTVTKSLKVKPLLIPALEDLETPSAKIDGANGAKDQIVAFIKRVIKAMQEAFARLGQWIVETYKRLTNAFSAVEARANKLAERVKASKMVEGQIDSKALAKKLTAGGVAVDDLSKYLNDLAAFAKAMNDPKTYAPYLEAIDFAEEMLKTPEKEEELRGKISEALGKWATQMEAIGHRASFKPADVAIGSNENVLKILAFALLDNQVLVSTIPSTAEGIRGMTSSVSNASADAGSASVPALDQAAAGKICAQVAELAKAAKEAVDGGRGGIKELNAELKKRNDTISAMANSALGQIMDEAGIKSEKFRKAAVFCNSLLMTAPKLPIHAVNRALPRSLGYALDYVAASLGGAAEEKSTAVAKA